MFRSIRQGTYEILGHLANAKYQIEALESHVLDEMKAGYRPTHRGVEWSREHYEALEMASVALDVAWDLMKAVQFPESMQGRLDDAQVSLGSLNLGDLTS